LPDLLKQDSNNQYLLQEAKEDITTDTMVFDHIRRMENFDGSHRSEYETALKYASSTSFSGNVPLTQQLMVEPHF